MNLEEVCAKLKCVYKVVRINPNQPEYITPLYKAQVTPTLYRWTQGKWVAYIGPSYHNPAECVWALANDIGKDQWRNGYRCQTRTMGGLFTRNLDLTFITVTVL